MFRILAFMISLIISKYKDAYQGLSRAVWLLSLIVLINRSGSMVLAFLTIYLTSELGLSITEAGVLLSLYGVGALFGTSFGGKLADKYSSILIQFFSLLFSGFLFLGLEFVTQKEWLFFYIPILSFCTEIFRPANAVSITHFSAEKNRTRAFALNRLAINLGMGIGPAIGGYLATENFVYLFRVDGLTCISASVFMLFFFKFSDVVPEKKTTDATTKKPFDDKHFLLFLLFTLMNAMCFFQLFSTMPLTFKLAGFQENIIGSFNGALLTIYPMLCGRPGRRATPKMWYI